jgi:ParB-like chromosome segregation protein Spo0J
MLKDTTIYISNIYVPVKRRKTLSAETVEQIAESIMDIGQTVPIQVRVDGNRYVLVEGLHRLEACKALGEKKISAYIVQSQKH